MDQKMPLGPSEKGAAEMEAENLARLDQRLWQAAHTGSAEEIDALLQKGASGNFRGNCDLTPLMAAATCKNNAACLRLIRASDPNAVDRYGRSALMLACANGADESARALAKISRINDQDCDGWTALSYAARMNQPACGLALAKEGAADLPDLFGVTALIAAADRGCRELVEELLGRKAVDKSEVLRAEEKARKSGHGDVADLIAAHVERSALIRSTEGRGTAPKARGRL